MVLKRGAPLDPSVRDARRARRGAILRPSALGSGGPLSSHSTRWNTSKVVSVAIWLVQLRSCTHSARWRRSRRQILLANLSLRLSDLQTIAEVTGTARDATSPWTSAKPCPRRPDRDWPVVRPCCFSNCLCAAVRRMSTKTARTTRKTTMLHPLKASRRAVRRPWSWTRKVRRVARHVLARSGAPFATKTFLWTSSPSGAVSARPTAKSFRTSATQPRCKASQSGWRKHATASDPDPSVRQFSGI